MDMRFHWLWCCDAQGQFHYYWQPWTQNLADYFTKHHPATHHKSVRPTILTAVNNPEYRKLFVTQDVSSPQINVKSGGTQRAQMMKVPTKTSVITNSFVKTLFQTPKPSLFKTLPGIAPPKLPMLSAVTSSPPAPRAQPHHHLSAPFEWTTTRP